MRHSSTSLVMYSPIGRMPERSVLARILPSLDKAEDYLIETFREACRECDIRALTPRQTATLLRDAKRLFIARFKRMRADKKSPRP